MNSARLSCLVVIVASSVACGGAKNWVAGDPVLFQAGAPQEAVFDKLVGAAKSAGYRIREEDASRGYFRVRSHVDNDIYLGGAWVDAEAMSDEEIAKTLLVGAIVTTGPSGSRISNIHVLVQDDGTIKIRADGYHIKRDGRMHVQLRQEMDQLAATLRDAVGGSTNAQTTDTHAAL